MSVHLGTRVLCLPKVFREAIITFFRSGKSTLVGQRDVIFLLLDESFPCACAEPGSSIENNSGDNDRHKAA
jgi:hypothetical protein